MSKQSEGTKINRIYQAVFAACAILAISLMIYRIGWALTATLLISFVYVFVVPGFALGLVIWRQWDDVTLLVRIISSVALSMVILPLTIFYTNKLFNVAINRGNVFYQILGISLIFSLSALLVHFWGSKHKTKL